MILTLKDVLELIKVENNEFQKNQLRDRAKKLPKITDEMWEEVLEHNRDMVQEFLDSNKHLSKKSLKQYTSGLRIFFYFVKEKLKNKELYKISKRDFVKYFAYLQDHGLSSSSLKFKKSAVSTLCNYIENIVAEDEEEYETFRNFCTAIKDIPKNQVYEKKAITVEEYEIIKEELLKKEKYLALAWVATMFNVGCRRSEVLKFKTEIIKYEKDEGAEYIDTHIVYAKGRAGGKPVRYMVNDEAMKYIKLWVDKRGYDHEYIFTSKYGGEPSVVSGSWSSDLCSNTLSKILGRRINVHLFKASCITKLLDDGIDISVVSEHIAQHFDVSTTQKFYDLRDKSAEKNNIFKKK